MRVQVICYGVLRSVISAERTHVYEMVIQNRAKKAKAVEDEEKARILGVYAEKPKMEATAARTHRPRPLADGFRE